MVNCPRCGQQVKDHYKVCPRCTLQLKKECPKCNELLPASWNACPLCGSVFTVQMPAQTAPARPQPVPDVPKAPSEVDRIKVRALGRCKGCGKIVPEGSKFCAVCGRDAGELAEI